MNSAPFFIVGSGRSGSTLLRMILASHSRLAIPPETRFLEPLVNQLPVHRPLSPEELAQAVGVITSNYRWPDMQMDVDEFQKAVSALDRPYLSRVAEVIYQHHMAKEGKQRWGDKTPCYIRIIPQLAQLFPGCRFIHMLRDGRDVAKSFQTTGWYGPWLHDNAAEWTEALDYEERWVGSHLAAEMLQVRYEELVRRPDETVRRICAFLDETFEPQMLSWQDHVPRLVPAREMSIHKKLTRSPDAADAERWRREMSTREVFVCEAFVGRHLARSGYGRKFANAAWEPAFALSRWYCRRVLPVVGFPKKKLWEWRQWRKHDGEL
jgi:Sulfotransferase family